MRRANDLPQKTKHIYCNLGKNKYFLDIATEDREKKLKFLIKIIFGKADNNELLSEAYSFMTNMAYDNNKNINGDIEFISPEWDQLLDDCLKEIYLDL